MLMSVPTTESATCEIGQKLCDRSSEVSTSTEAAQIVQILSVAQATAAAATAEDDV